MIECNKCPRCGAGHGLVRVLPTDIFPEIVGEKVEDRVVLWGPDGEQSPLEIHVMGEESLPFRLQSSDKTNLTCLSDRYTTKKPKVDIGAIMEKKESEWSSTSTKQMFVIYHRSLDYNFNWSYKGIGVQLRGQTKGSDGRSIDISTETRRESSINEEKLHTVTSYDDIAMTLWYARVKHEIDRLFEFNKVEENIEDFRVTEETIKELREAKQ